MKMMDEFKAFISRGNVVDLAVGVIVGGAFGKITSSLVADVVMPPLGLLVSDVHVANLKWVIGGKPDAPVAINYGLFIQNTLDFLIISFAVFLMIKAINLFHKREEEKPPSPREPTPEEKLLIEIRDLLKEKATP